MRGKHHAVVDHEDLRIRGGESADPVGPPLPEGAVRGQHPSRVVHHLDESLAAPELVHGEWRRAQEGAAVVSVVVVADRLRLPGASYLVRHKVPSHRRSGDACTPSSAGSRSPRPPPSASDGRSRKSS